MKIFCLLAVLLPSLLMGGAELSRESRLLFFQLQQRRMELMQQQPVLKEWNERMLVLQRKLGRKLAVKLGVSLKKAELPVLTEAQKKRAQKIISEDEELSEIQTQLIHLSEKNHQQLQKDKRYAEILRKLQKGAQP